MEQLLTGDVWKQVNKLLTRRQRKTACIAYVTSEHLQLSKGDILLCDASDHAIRMGQTSAKTLAKYLKKGVQVYSQGSLHAKLLLTDRFVVMGSANLSQSSANKLTECCLLTDNAALRSQTKAFCYSLLQEAKPLDAAAIRTLQKINVIKRPFAAVKASKTRRQQFGHRCWYVSVSLISDRTYNNIKEIVDEAITSVSAANDLREDDVSYLRWRHTKTGFSHEARAGDQVIVRLNLNSRSYVSPPATILQKDVEGGFVYFYYDDPRDDERLSWTSFARGLKRFAVDTALTTRTKVVPDKDLQKLQGLWDDAG